MTSGKELSRAHSVKAANPGGSTDTDRIPLPRSPSLVAPPFRSSPFRWVPYAADKRYSPIHCPRIGPSTLFADALQTHQPIDFDAEVNLFHFNLLRCVGKGAFGKVCIVSMLSQGPSCSSLVILRPRRSESFSTSRRRISTPSNTSTKLVASSKKRYQTSFRRGGCSKRSVYISNPPPALGGRHLSQDPLTFPVVTFRSITLSSLTCAMPSKTTRIAFSCSTSCLEVTSDVSMQGDRMIVPPPLKPFRLLLARRVSVHLERLGNLTEEAVRLYTAELSSALSYLHEKRIIHRSVDTPVLFLSGFRLPPRSNQI